MKKIIKFVIGIVLMLVSVIAILLSGTLLSIIVGGIFSLIGLIFFYKNFFFWKHTESEVPKEITDEFELLERRLKNQSDNEEPKDGSRILWERYRETIDGRKSAFNHPIEKQGLHGQPSGREDFSDVPTPSDREKYRGDKQNGTISTRSNKSRPRRKIGIFRGD